jgi:hypothetical protein
MVLNRRLPRITARALLPIVPFGDYSASRTDELSRVETFPGAACLTRFPVMHAPRLVSSRLFGSVKSGSPAGGGHTPPPHGSNR